MEDNEVSNTAQHSTQNVGFYMRYTSCIYVLEDFAILDGAKDTLNVLKVTVKMFSVLKNISISKIYCSF